MITRQDHLIHHDPINNHLYVSDCPHCRLERRKNYGNQQSRRNRTSNYQNDNHDRRIVESSFQNLNNRRIINQTRRSRETYLEYNQHGEIDGFQVIEPIPRNRYIIEHYLYVGGPGNHWYLDGLMVVTGDELNGQHNPVHENTADVVVYTSVYHLNKNTQLIIHNQEESDQEKCIICLANYQKGENLRKINYCQHLFHQECFDQWVETNHRCPSCNFDIVG